MLTLQGVTYIHPNRDLLFSNLNLAINKQEKIALIGNNGVGKINAAENTFRSFGRLPKGR